jgi:hypothetical protein
VKNKLFSGRESALVGENVFSGQVIFLARVGPSFIGEWRWGPSGSPRRTCKPLVHHIWSSPFCLRVMYM